MSDGTVRVIGGHYELGRQLSDSGSFAVVYEGRDRVADTRVALKLFRPMTGEQLRLARRSLQNQLEAHMSMGPHPNIVAVRHVTTCEVFGPGTLVLVTELVDGCDLQAWLAKDPSATARLDLLGQLARGLAHAHQNGVSHGDLSFGNVLVAEAKGQAPSVRLTDFGSARLQSAVSKGLDWSQTFQGFIVATVEVNPPPWTGPEASRLGPQRDVYGLAVLAYLVLTGQHPLVDDWRAQSTSYWIGENAHKKAPRRSLVALSRGQVVEVGPGFQPSTALEALLLRCLDPSEEKRPPSAGAVADRWGAAAKSWGREPATAPAGPQGRRRCFAKVLLAVSLTAIAAGFALIVATALGG